MLERQLRTQHTPEDGFENGACVFMSYVMFFPAHRRMCEVHEPTNNIFVVTTDELRVYTASIYFKTL